MCKRNIRVEGGEESLQTVMKVNIYGKRKGREETWVEECMVAEQWREKFAQAVGRPWPRVPIGRRLLLAPLQCHVHECSVMSNSLCNPLNCSPPGSSVHGIFQVRMLEWVAISSSKGIFLTQVSSPCLLWSLPGSVP